MNLSVYSFQNDLEIDRDSVGPLIERVLSLEGVSTDHLEVSFVSIEEICSLHERFFQDNSPTDCISLPMDQEINGSPHVLGEIFVCPAVALERVGPESAHLETTLYLVHSLLHLFGYNDLEPAEQKVMGAKEELYLQLLTQEKLLLTHKLVAKKKLASYSCVQGKSSGSYTRC